MVFISKDKNITLFVAMKERFFSLDMCVHAILMCALDQDYRKMKCQLEHKCQATIR